MNSHRSIIVLLLLSLAANMLLCLSLVSKNADATKAGFLNAATRSDNHSAPKATGSTQPNRNTLWTTLSSSNLTVLMENLRTAGFAPDLIRSIIREIVQEKYMPRLLGLGAARETPYWKTSDTYFVGSRREQEHRQIELAMSKELQSLLGTDYFIPDADSLSFYQYCYGELPPQKIAKVISIKNDYMQMQQAVYRNETANKNARNERIKILDQEMHRDLEKLLTPDELFDYDLRTNPTSNQLREASVLLGLQENEFRGLFPIHQAIEAELSDSIKADYTASANARFAAIQKYEAQIKSVLGAERFSDYLQANNPEAIPENNLVRRLGLPLSTAAQLVETRKNYSERAQLIRNNNQLTPRQKLDQLTSNASVAAQSISAHLDDRGVRAYSAHGGSWLESIAQP